MVHLVIVESPAKAKTINKYLGGDYKVVASYGHIRDLPSKNGSVLPDEDFKMIYEISGKSDKQVKAIVDAVKTADTLFLATDPDREGEAISWHIVETLKAKKALKASTPVKRIVFNEITKKAVTEAFTHPRDVDMDLVNAQQARRALDYLVGFTLSPVLWRKLPGSKSAGRVQSVALRLIAEREQEIEQFVTQEYWDIAGFFLQENDKKKRIKAMLTHVEGKKLSKFSIPNESEAKSIATQLKQKHYSVASIENKQMQRNPHPPFTTSSLQQEAARKLGFATNKTMLLAQKLYEGIDIGGETVGLITYMRTDGVQVSKEAVDVTRSLIGKHYGADFVPKQPRLYTSKAKNAQEAHEAIRPTFIDKTPDQIKAHLDGDMFKLYELIWKRMVASQMENMVLDQVAVTINSSDGYASLRATGSTVRFAGFSVLYRESKDDEAEEEETQLPPLTEKQALALHDITPAQHFTEPPPRYTEASLVKKMEELGIGRPSTYAAIISVLQDRKYVKLEKKRFVPEERGRLVTAFLTNFFKRYVEYDFTAQLENQLDDISAGSISWKEVLRLFWNPFFSSTEDVKKLDNNHILETLNQVLEAHIFPSKDGKAADRHCPSCSNGQLSLKLGRYGAFIACSNYPECRYTKPLDTTENAEGEEGQNGEEGAIPETRVLGKDPKTGEDVTVRKGPYGFYVQLGEAVKGSKTKPKRMTLPASVTPIDITLEMALSLLSLPREIGIHPETKTMITAGIGRFGPYLLHQGSYTSVPKTDDVLTVGINRAVDILAEAYERKLKKGTATPLRVVGAHPKSGKDIAIYDGRYGPYIKFGTSNISLPKGANIDQISVDEAVQLIEAHKEKKKKA